MHYSTKRLAVLFVIASAVLTTYPEAIVSRRNDSEKKESTSERRSAKNKGAEKKAEKKKGTMTLPAISLFGKLQKNGETVVID